MHLEFHGDTQTLIIKGRILHPRQNTLTQSHVNTVKQLVAENSLYLLHQSTHSTHRSLRSLNKHFGTTAEEMVEKQ